MNTNQLSSQRLAELCQQRLAILKQMKETYLEQLQALDDSEWLMSTMAKKQYLLDRLLAVHAEIAPFQAEDPDLRDWPSRAEREACQRIADEGQAILVELKTIEQNTIDMMQTRFQLVKGELQMVQAAMLAQQAYASHDQEHAALETMSGLSLEG